MHMRGGRWTNEDLVTETNPRGIVHAHYDPATDRWTIEPEPYMGVELATITMETSELIEAGYRPDSEVGERLYARAAAGPVDIDGGGWRFGRDHGISARYSPSADEWTFTGGRLDEPVQLKSKDIKLSAFRPAGSLARRVYLRAVGLFDDADYRVRLVPSQDPIHHAAIGGMRVTLGEGD